MDEPWSLTEHFEMHRSRLRAVAYRMLGSRSDAEDAVQETWLRLNRAHKGSIENLAGWTTTVIGRVCINMLNTRRSRREEPLGGHDQPGLAVVAESSMDPEDEALLADSVGVALVVLLNTLTAEERLTFVLHDLFGLSFKEIAPIVDRSTTATRQLASRARRRVRGAPDGGHGVSALREQEVVDAFLAASREGDLDRLIELLSEDVAVHADRAAVQAGAARVVRGAANVAEAFMSRIVAFQPVLVDGVPGLAWIPHERVRAVLLFRVHSGRIADIELVGNPHRIRRFDVMLLTR